MAVNTRKHVIDRSTVHIDIRLFNVNCNRKPSLEVLDGTVTGPVLPALNTGIDIDRTWIDMKEPANVSINFISLHF